MSLAFGLVTFALLGSALRVVTSKNLVHTVLWLGIALAATAVLYVLLAAPFLAAMQLMLYTGGVLTLMLFGVMLTTRDAGFVSVPSTQGRRGPGAVLGVLVFSMLAVAIARTPGLERAPAADPVTTAELGELLLRQHALAFEVLSVLLFVAALGAIVLARRKDAGEEPAAPEPGVIPRGAKPADPQPPTEAEAP